MHHRTAADADRDLLPEVAVGADHVVLHGVSPTEVVRNRMELTGFRIPRWVRCVSAANGAVEVADIDSVEFLGQFHARQTALDQGERLAGEPDDVRVRRRSVQG